MPPATFLRLLLERRGIRESALAKMLGRPTDQGTISKFLAGSVQNPRGQWSKLAPKELGFSPLALFDAEVADQEAQRLGLLAAAVSCAPKGLDFTPPPDAP